MGFVDTPLSLSDADLQGSRLNDPRFSVIQQQLLAAKIGQIQGNNHLKKIIATNMERELHSENQYSHIQRHSGPPDHPHPHTDTSHTDRASGQSEPLMISATTFQEAAQAARSILEEVRYSGSVRIIVINGPNIQIFNERAEPVGPSTFRLNTPAQMPNGVFVSRPGERALRFVTRGQNGRLTLDGIPSVPIDFASMVNNQEAFDRASRSNGQIYVVPTSTLAHPNNQPTEFPQQEEQPKFMHFTPTDHGNLPAWPAAVMPVPPTSQIASVNSTGSFVIRVQKNQGINTLDRVTNLMEPTNFRWEVLRLDTQNQIRDTRAVTRMDGVRAGYARRRRNIADDAQTIRGVHPERQSLPERVARRYIAQQMTDSRMILAMAGQTALTIIHALAGNTNTPNIEDFIDIPWNEPGDYFVRCLATPVSSPNARYRRATSVAGLMVSVYDIAEIARESMPSVESERTSAQSRARQLEQQRDELDANFDEGDVFENSARLNELEMQITYERELEQIAGNTRSAMQAELNYIQAQIDYLTGPNAPSTNHTARLQRLRESQREIRAQLERADSQLGSDVTATTMMPGVLVDEATGSRKQLTFSIGERTYINTNQLEVVIADVTDGDGGVFSGRGSGWQGSGRQEAWQSAMQDLRRNLGRGRAWLAYRPPVPYASLALDLPNPMQLQMAPLDQAREMVDDAAHAATLVALIAAPFTEGASLGVLGVLAPIQATSSLYNIVNRSAYDRLELDAEAVNDFINIATLGLGQVGQAGQFASRGTQILYTSSRVAARLLERGTYVVMAYQAYQQITAVVPGEDPREGRRRRLIALLGILEGASIPVAGHLWPHGSHDSRGLEHPSEIPNRSDEHNGSSQAGEHEGDRGTAPLRPRRSQVEIDALNASLPPDLSGHVPIIENPSLSGHTVRVYYEDGILRMEVGPTALPSHVSSHIQTARVLIRYQGVVGMIRRLSDRIMSWLRIQPGYGDTGFEARLEVQKLREILLNLEARQADIDARARRLNQDGNLADTRAEANAIDREIVSLREQIAQHEAEVNSYTQGRGYVAAEDTTSDTIHQTPSAASREEANDWELIAGDYDDAAARHRQTATSEQVIADQLRAANRLEEAQAAEGRSALAHEEAVAAERAAQSARQEVARLRGGTEGLSAQQLRQRQELITTRSSVRPDVERLAESVSQKQRELDRAERQLSERRESLRRIERNRRTRYTREWALADREYERELQNVRDALGSSERRVAAKRESLDQARREQAESQRQLDRINRELNDLANLERGLSEHDNNAKGIFAEAKADEYMESQGFEKIGGHGDSPQGLDGIYRRGTAPNYEYVIGEAKYDTSRLEMTEDGLQLSRTWCDRRIDRAVRYGRSEDEARILAADIRRRDYHRQVLRYDPRLRRIVIEPPPN